VRGIERSPAKREREKEREREREREILRDSVESRFPRARDSSRARKACLSQPPPPRRGGGRADAVIDRQIQFRADNETPRGRAKGCVRRLRVERMIVLIPIESRRSRTSNREAPSARGIARGRHLSRKLAKRENERQREREREENDRERSSDRLTLASARFVEPAYAVALDWHEMIEIESLEFLDDSQNEIRPVPIKNRSRIARRTRTRQIKPAGDREDTLCTRGVVPLPRSASPFSWYFIARIPALSRRWIDNQSFPFPLSTFLLIAH